jgi:hypothetical protein
MVFLVLIIGIGLVSSIHHLLQYKQTWDIQYLEEGKAFQYASENFNPRFIGVSPRLYTLAGYYFPNSRVYPLLLTDYIKTSVKNGRFDLIVWQCRNSIIKDIEESHKYKLVNEFNDGKIKIFVKITVASPPEATQSNYQEITKTN